MHGWLCQAKKSQRASYQQRAPKVPVQTPVLCARQKPGWLQILKVQVTALWACHMSCKRPLSDLGEREATLHVAIVSHRAGDGHRHQSAHRGTAQQGWKHLQRISANSWSSGKSPAGSGLMPAKGKTHGEKTRGGQERVKRSRGCRRRREQ